MNRRGFFKAVCAGLAAGLGGAAVLTSKWLEPDSIVVSDNVDVFVNGQRLVPKGSMWIEFDYSAMEPIVRSDDRLMR